MTSNDWPLGEQLRTHRKAARLSMREAAHEAGFSVTTWQQLERGTKTVSGISVGVNPRSSVIVAAARAVGLDSSEALRAAGRNPDGYFAPEESISPTVSQRAVLETFARLNKQQRRAVYFLLLSMLGETDDSGEDATSGITDA